MAVSVTACPAPPAVIRGIGGLSLTAIAVNTMVGAGIFAQPAIAAQLLGPASPLAYLTAGAAVLLIALCFAEAGSCFDRSGGPYLYASAAFGPLAGFEVALLFVLARVTAVAAVTNTFCSYLGYFWPAAAHGLFRLLTITTLIGILTIINCLGLRQGVRTNNLLTIAKLLPLLVFGLVGLFFLNPHRFSFTSLPSVGSLQQASLLLMFAFGGFEAASIPSEEVRHPGRVVPVALLCSVGMVASLYLLIQVVAVGTLPGLAASSTPLSSAALGFLGPAGGLLLTVGAIASTTGTASATILVGPRMLYAMAQQGQLPSAMGRIHPRYLTPAISIVLFASVAWALAVSGTFGQLAAASAIARLLLYVTTCLAVPVLRRKMPPAERRFTLAGGFLIPALALAVCAWLLFGMSWKEALAAAAFLLAGALLYALFTRGRRTR